MNKTQAAAAHWFALMQDCAADHPERKRFEAWLAADPVHEAAYAKLTRIWAQLDSSAVDIGVLADAVERRRNLLRQERRRFLRQGVLGLLLVGGAGEFLYRHRQGETQWHLVRQTEVGQVQSLSLPDGSRLTVGGDTELSFDFSRAQRHVLLARGEAVFEVARDIERPFVVDSRALQITVLGTRFAVACLSDRIRISVDHGMVRLVSGPFWRRRELILQNGQVAELATSPDAPPAFTWLNRPAADGFAFEQGQIVFHRAHLDEIAETLSRYRRKPLSVMPDSPPSPPVTAVVQLGDIDTFLTYLPSIFPVTVTDSANKTWLASKPR